MTAPASPSPRWLRALGLATVAVLLALVARFWHPVYGFTAFYQLDAANDDLKIAAFREHPVLVYRDTGGYDGLYYAQIAHDPTLRDPALPRAMDNFAYRARRILPPALAWLLGAGQPAWIIPAYALLNVGAWLALAALLWRLLPVADLRGWLAWAGVLFSAGALSSIRLALTDLVALAILAGAMLALERGRAGTAAATLAAAALARETSLAALAGFLAPPWLSRRNLGRVLLAIAPLVAWLLYVRWRAGAADQGWSNFTLPVAGLVEKWRAALHAATTHGDRPLAWTTLLATVALTVQAAYVLLRPRPSDPWWRIGAAYVAILLCLGTAVWEGFPGAATRVLLPLNLAFNVLVVRARAPLAWLVAGNLTVFAGFLALRDVPVDPTEIAAGRAHRVACVARTGEGWFGREATRRHVWFWTAGRATLTLEAWPRVDATVQLDVTLRNLAPRRVIARQDGREIWHADLTADSASVHRIPLQLASGRATIEFTTDTPPVRENDSAEARDLAFALYDPRLSVTQP